MTKDELRELLHRYNCQQGSLRIIFGDTQGIKELKKFYDRDLANKAAEYVLNNHQIELIKNVLANRFDRVFGKTRSYRKKPKKLTNQIFVELAKLASNNQPEVFILVQCYINDYSIKGKLLKNVTEQIFVTERNYAYPLNELVEHIKESNTLSAPIPGESLSQCYALSEVDLANLQKIGEMKNLIEKILCLFDIYTNKYSLYEENLYLYRQDELFVTEDMYCFVISELLLLIKARGKLYNPYTSTPFSDSDYDKLTQIPAISSELSSRKLNNLKNATLISSQTVDQLHLLAKGLLNDKEIYQSTHTDVPVAQSEYEIFDKYYKTLPDTEREALNDYWIEQWDTTRIGFRGVYGISQQQFGLLYSTLNHSCIHTAGFSIAKMVLQLDPERDFKFNKNFPTKVLAKIR